MLIDTHAHLTDEIYGGAETIVESMASDGLEKIISIGYDLHSSAGAKAIAKKNKQVYFAAGIHPSEVALLPSDYTVQLEKLASDKKCVAIGEIGLDYHYDGYDAAQQQRVLISQLDLCEKTGLPAVFHVRDAYGDMAKIVRENLTKLPSRGVVHCFSGSKETALEYIAMGFYISFTGAITFKNAVKFPEILCALPKNRVLVETDCPYLTPMPYRGQVNYPKHVRFVAERVAEIWGVSVADVEKITTQNAYDCFKKLG